MSIDSFYFTPIRNREKKGGGRWAQEPSNYCLWYDLGPTCPSVLTLNKVSVVFLYDANLMKVTWAPNIIFFFSNPSLQDLLWTSHHHSHYGFHCPFTSFWPMCLPPFFFSSWKPVSYLKCSTFEICLLVSRVTSYIVHVTHFACCSMFPCTILFLSHVCCLNMGKNQYRWYLVHWDGTNGGEMEELWMLHWYFTLGLSLWQEPYLEKPKTIKSLGWKENRK